MNYFPCFRQRHPVYFSLQSMTLFTFTLRGLQAYTQGRRQVKKCGMDTHGEHAVREPITVFGGGAPSGVQGQSPGQRVRGQLQSPLKLKTF